MRKVSIIIPIYNAEEYLEECLTSVLAMKGDHIEFLLIDDGSTDKSPVILRRYMKQDPRIVLYTKKNSGASDTRNFGISKATGDYICFVDADDFVDPRMVDLLLENIGDADICVGKKTRWNQIKDFKTVDAWEGFTGTVKELKKVYRKYRRSMRGATGRLYRTDIIRKYDIRFRKDYNYAEDMHFNYDYFCHVNKVCFVDDPVYTYRIHNPESLSSKNAPFFLKQWKMELGCEDKLFDPL